MAISRNRKLGHAVIELFSGAGGLSWGWHRIGLPPDIAIDCDAAAIDTHQLNFPTTIAVRADLSRYSPRDLSTHMRLDRGVLAILGGPPCQGWSTAGRGKLRSLHGRAHSLVNDPRNTLYRRFVHFVKSLKPAVFVMENVPGMRRIEGQDISEAIVANFDEVGYEATCAIVNARHFGVPQDRRRLIFIGARKDLGVSILASELADYAPVFRERVACLPSETTVRQAISDLPPIDHGTRLSSLQYRPGRASAYAALMRGGCDVRIDDHICRWHNQQDLLAFQVLRQGGKYIELPDELKRYRDDIFKDKYRKMSWQAVAGTVTAHLSKDCYSHIHPEQKRTVSVREAARLQSFPDIFRFSGSMGAQFRQIGNAVPPLMAWGIAQFVANHLPLHAVRRR